MDTPGHVLKKLMKSIDTDGDGTLSFVEFRNDGKGKNGAMAEMLIKLQSTAKYERREAAEVETRAGKA